MNAFPWDALATLATGAVSVVAVWVALRALRADHRPRLRVGLITSTLSASGDRLYPDETSTIEVDIVNYGDRRANIVSSHCQYLVAKQLPMERPYGDHNCNNFFGVATIEAGNSFRGTCLQTLFAQQVDQIRSKTHKLYVIGFIRYNDWNRYPRRTMFCSEYDVDLDRYKRVDDPDYFVEN